MALVQMYGVRWPDSYGDLPPKMWCEFFDKCNDLEIANALQHCVLHHQQYPPSLPQFYQAVKESNKPKAERPKQLDHFEISRLGKKANFVMLDLTLRMGGLHGCLQKVLAEKNRLVQQYDEIAKDEEVDLEEFVSVVTDRLEAVYRECRG